MDAELLFWICVFLGGYAVVLVFLLRLVLRRKPDAPGSHDRSS